MSDDIVTIKTDIAAINQNISNMERWLTKLDDTVVSRLDAVVEGLAKVTTKIEVSDTKLGEAQRRITNIETELEEVATSRSVFENSIREQLNSYRVSQEKSRETNHKEIIDALTEMNKDLSAKLEAQDGRISDLEMWRYYLIGGGAVIGFIFSTLMTIIDFSSLW